MIAYLAHFGIGIAGAGCAVCGRRFCSCKRNAIAISVALVAAEAVASVHLIG